MNFSTSADATNVKQCAKRGRIFRSQSELSMGEKAAKNTVKKRYKHQLEIVYPIYGTDLKPNLKISLNFI